MKDATIESGGITNVMNMRASNVITIGIGEMDHSNDWGRGNGSRGGHRSRHIFENTRMF